MHLFSSFLCHFSSGVVTKVLIFFRTLSQTVTLGQVSSQKSLYFLKHFHKLSRIGMTPYCEAPSIKGKFGASFIVLDWRLFMRLYNLMGWSRLCNSGQSTILTSFSLNRLFVLSHSLYLG